MVDTVTAKYKNWAEETDIHVADGRPSYEPDAKQSGFDINSREIIETKLPSQHSLWLKCSLCYMQTGSLD